MTRFRRPHGFFLFLLSLVLSAVLAGPAAATLTLAAEVNPDPVQPSENLDAQVTVASSAASGSLVLRLLWPAAMGIQVPSTSGGGSCPGSCDPGEQLTWNLGALGAGAATTVGFAELVPSNAANGVVIPFQFELLEDGVSRALLTKSVTVAADSPLELTSDPLADPVAPGGLLTYELTFGNAGSVLAGDAMLSFPVPAGSFFRGAAGGILDDGVVRFDLGDLPPGAWGRRRVELFAPSQPAGSLLAPAAAEIVATVAGQPRRARAAAVSRIGSSAIVVAMESQADPVVPSELIATRIAVWNGGAASTGSLVLRVLWPQEIHFSTPVTTSGGACPGACEAGEFLTWNLGVLGPGASQVVAFDDTPNTVPDGTLIPFEIELLQGGAPVATLSRTLVMDRTSPLELAIEPREDPVPAGGLLTYDLTYGNTAGVPAAAMVLSCPIPAGTIFVAATGEAHVAAGRVVWPLGSLPANSGGRVQLQVRPADTPATGLVEVKGADLDATVDGLEEGVRASSVSRVGIVAPVNLVTGGSGANPIDSNQNITGSYGGYLPFGAPGPTGNLTVRLLWPDEMGTQSPVITAGGSCPGSCDKGEYLTWSLPPLDPNTVAIGEFSQNLPFLQRGTLVPFESELLENGVLVATHTDVLLVHASSPDSDSDSDPNILDPDDDGDGMPDTWESRYGLNPLNAADATQNPDGDGLVNYDEFRLGYHPRVADYVFADGFESGGTTRWH